MVDHDSPFQLHTGRLCCTSDLLTLKVSPLLTIGAKKQWCCSESLLATVKNRLLRTGSSWNIKLHPTVRVCDYASASNFCIIFVLLVCMYYEDRAPSDNIMYAVNRSISPSTTAD